MLSVAGDDRDHNAVLQVEPEVGEVLADTGDQLLKARFRVSDQVHLVDRDDDLMDAEEVQQACRRVCSCRLRRASTTSTAASACAAPVIMFLRTRDARRVDQHVVAHRRAEEDLRGCRW